MPFAKAGVKVELAYKAQIVMWIIISFVEVMFVVFLYGAIYRSSENGMDSIINGFSFTEMILYMITSFFFSFVMGSGDTSYEIATDIREGTIANTLTKPVSYTRNAIWNLDARKAHATSKGRVANARALAAFGKSYTCEA